MTTSNNKRSVFAEETVKRLIRLICYISLPLIFLFALTIGSSLIATGDINADVNEVTDFATVLVSFSLPMIIALAAVPLLIKIKAQKRKASELGLALPRKPVTWIICGITSVGSIVLAGRLSGVDGLEISPWTICIHFFFVAVAEEIMLRSIVLDELKGFTANPWLLCLLDAMIFAFVYHSNDAFLPNLLVRVPLGFVLSITAVKSNSIYPAIGVHWLYNMLVTTI